ncbi:MAG: glycosyltransferase [Muribaculaceae bacterium]|nr:glycosyltransferase [Muribaculaceae bacterium]
MELMQKVTIITVCYNVKEALSKTVESVLGQDYQNLEYIIIDGQSTDGTSDYLKSLPADRIKWISEPDGGIYDAMNKGVKMATGQWILFMNAADTFVDSSIVSQVFANDTSDAEIIYGAVQKNGVVKQAEPVHNSHRMFFCHQCVFTRDYLLRDNPFDTHYKMSADFKFFKQMVLQKRRFLKTDIAIANFDTSGISNSSRAAGVAENIRIIFELDSTFDKLRLAPRMIFQYIMCKLRGWVRNLAKNNQHEQ